MSDARNIAELNHGSSLEIQSYVGEGKWSSYFKFSFVRNPFDRVVSLYEFLRQIKAGQGDEYREFEKMTFEEFIKEECLSGLEEQVHLKPQHTFVAEGSAILVDYLGRFESLRSDCRLICEKLDIEMVALPHIYKTERSHYREYYSASTRKIIESRYAKDLELFNYQF